MMYRSASTNRVLDGHLNHYSSPSSSKIPQSLRALSLETKGFPRYGSPLSDHVAKKGRARGRLFSENGVHVIPMVLLLSALILWLVSNPDVDLATEGVSIVDRIGGLTIKGDGNNDRSQTGSLTSEWDDADPTEQSGDLRIAFSHRKSLLRL